MSNLPTFTMRQLIEAGVHFGHKTMRWNPRMSPYIFGIRNDIHIIDLQQTVPMLYQALQVVHDVVSKGGRVLFVGTKRQASDIIAESATRCGQYYINYRWPGGLLTNWNTVSASIKTLKNLEEELSQTANDNAAAEEAGEDLSEVKGRLTKKELLKMSREQEKLDRSLGGIKNMAALPDLLFVIDTNKESLAIKDAQKLGIPVIAILDTNSDPDGITYPVPGNDDATRAIKLYCDLVCEAVLGGIQHELSASGVDLGESAEPGQDGKHDGDDAPIKPLKKSNKKAS